MFDIAKQYTRFERGQLIVANRLRRWVMRRLFYLESDLVFASLSRGAGSSRRDGRANWLEYPDEKLGVWCVRLRRHTSDFRVFREIVLQRQYEPVVQLLRHCEGNDAVATIVDAGANIGLASIYFSRSFPAAKVIALESDEENYKACSINIASAEATKVVPLHQALWNENIPLEAKSDFRDGREWSRSVGVSASGQGSVRGVSVSTIIDEHQLPSIDLLKIDIEGSEAAVFDEPSSVDRWLPKVQCLAIEIHERVTYERIVPQLRARGFLVFDRGEMTIALRRERIRTESLLDYFENSSVPRESPILA